jgi:predicted HTH transcriptional regulator
MHPIQELIAQGEHRQLDFKFQVNDARKIARSMVSFANTDGGRLLIGVKDNGKLAGIRSEEEIYMIETAAQLYTTPQVAFTPMIWEVDGKTILEIIIAPSMQRPHYVKELDGVNKAYYREGDRVLEVNGVMLQLWKMDRKRAGEQIEFSKPMTKLLRRMNSKGPVGFNFVRQVLRLSPAETEQVLASLIQWEIIEMLPGEKGYRFHLLEQGEERNDLFEN